jgi:hypothetical protein
MVSVIAFTFGSTTIFTVSEMGALQKRESITVSITEYVPRPA